MQSCWSDKKFVGVEVALHENDQGELPSNHAMEDVDWVHEVSRWIYKFNGCTNCYG
jgi:hypothetical protein